MLPAIPGSVYQRLVVGYHGCDRRVAERVLLSGEHLKKSRNRYDWLGEGIYSWEYGHRRAREFAEWKARRGEIAEPDVIGAYLYLGRCFDLADTWATSELAAIHQRLVSDLGIAREPVPENRPAGKGDFDRVLRDLDCAVINAAVARFDLGVGPGSEVQTVRGVFVEGEAPYAGAGFRTKTHVQIAVRDLGCILGYFRPPATYTPPQEHP